MRRSNSTSRSFTPPPRHQVTRYNHVVVTLRNFFVASAYLPRSPSLRVLFVFSSNEEQFSLLMERLEVERD